MIARPNATQETKTEASSASQLRKKETYTIQVDLNQFPKTSENKLIPMATYSVGDLHANPLKLLTFLIVNNILLMKPNDYDEVVKLYNHGFTLSQLQVACMKQPEPMDTNSANDHLKSESKQDASMGSMSQSSSTLFQPNQKRTRVLPLNPRKKRTQSALKQNVNEFHLQQLKGKHMLSANHEKEIKERITARGFNSQILNCVLLFWPLKFLVKFNSISSFYKRFYL